MYDQRLRLRTRLEKIINGRVREKLTQRRARDSFIIKIGARPTISLEPYSLVFHCV